MPGPGEDLKTQAGWDAFVRRHGGNVGEATLAKGQYRDSAGTVRDDKTKRPIPADQVQWRYELADGSSVEIDETGKMGTIDEKAPSVATGTKAPGTSDWSGQRMQIDPADNQYKLYGFDPNDDNPATKFKPVPSAPSQPLPNTARQPAAVGDLQRLDKNAQLIPPGDTTTPVAKVRDPGTGTVTDMPDPTKEPEGKYEKFGNTVYFLKAGQDPKPVLQNVDPVKPSTFQGPDGAQWEYDPSKPEGQRARKLTEGKPEVTSASNILWRAIPGTNDEQGYRVVDGKQVDVEGAIKPRATTLMGDANSEKWTVLDAQQNVIKTIDNPGYRAKLTTITTDTGTPNIVQTDPTGKVISTESPNYQPTTAAQIAGQTAKLNQMMAAKAAELKAKVDAKTITPDEYAAQFNAWFDQTIEPQKQYLTQAQVDIERKRAIEDENQRRQALQQAQVAGKDVVAGVQAQYPYMVGPKAGEVAAAAMKGQLPSGADLAQSAFFQLPDTEKLYQQATMRALAQISPTAAAATGAPVPNPQNVNIDEQLARTNYAYQGQPTPQPQAGPPGVPPPGPVTADPSALLAPGLAGTNQDPNVQASGGVPTGYPSIYPPYGPRGTWTQNMPNFGNPQLPPYVYGG